MQRWSAITNKRHRHCADCTHGETQEEWMERPSCKFRRCWATSAQESRTSFNLKNKNRKMKRRNKGIFFWGFDAALIVLLTGGKHIYIRRVEDGRLNVLWRIDVSRCPAVVSLVDLHTHVCVWLWMALLCIWWMVFDETLSFNDGKEP